MENAKVVKEVLTDRSVAWNVEYHEGTPQKGFVNITIGCVDQNAAELLAECLNEASWVQADVGD